VHYFVAQLSQGDRVAGPAGCVYELLVPVVLVLTKSLDNSLSNE